jgi:hypothetical protein
MVRATGIGLLLALVFALPAPAQDKEKQRKALDYSRKIDSALKKKDWTLASDGEFLRRVYLDLVGTIPTLSETRAFLADTSPTKRQDVIEKLLATEAHADLWARIWATILFGNYYDIRANIGGKNVVNKVIRKAMDDFRKWLRDHIAKDSPWQTIVAELIQAQGKLSENPILIYKTAAYYEGEAYLNLADSMSKSLLGMRISCARCHDHPFDRWTQEDYYGLAAFFVRMRARPAPSGGKMGQDNNDTDDVEFGEEMKGELSMPETSKMMRPKFLFGGAAGTQEMRLPALARFMVMKENSQLPRNVVNRVWAWFMGRGFVEPVDDFNMQNKPASGSLMEELVKGFVGNGYSLRFLFRAICNSEAYQRASAGTGTEVFANTGYRQLTGEQLFKALVTAAYTPETMVDFSNKDVLRGWAGFRDQLRPVFGADNNWTEVTPLPGNTRQVLLLRNGPTVDGALKSGEGLMGRLQGTTEQKIETIFLAVLTRPPTEDETKRYAAYVKERGDDRDAYEDAIWTLLNSAEFILRH